MTIINPDPPLFQLDGPPWVYAMWTPKRHNQLKVGWTTDLKRRAKELDACLLWAGCGGRTDELAILKRYQWSRVGTHSEWLVLTPRVLNGFGLRWDARARQPVVDQAVRAKWTYRPNLTPTGRWPS